MTDIKKSSYYVLFLGAKESKGLRGPHYVEPVLQYFVSQESRMQALKVTLQVSNKGLKIIPCNQRVVGVSSSEGNNQTEKHFIPHHAITCVFQAPPPNDDIVSCILLIYNPDTKCPVHVHCYRCDSPETASVLKEQLEQLVNREDNQKKFRDIESRLQSKGLLPCQSPSKGRDRGTPDFDCRTSDSSENSDRGFGSGSGSSNLTSDRIATLYDSLAAELREKLSARKRNTPLLFPPRDYDTIHRQRGNLLGIESRRCSNPAVVGATGNRRSYASREQESCGRSSGIGSTEDNCTPIHDALMENNVGPSSSEEEEWNSSHLIATETSQFLVRPVWPQSSESNLRHSHHHSQQMSPHRSQQSPHKPQHQHQLSPPHGPPSASPVPPPLPKRPELRQRSPDLSSPPPPVPVFSRERFEGVRQKWEKLDHQYVRQRSHDSLDEGYRSREAAEADYRRQLSRESLLRSLSRSKTGSRDSLDRWVENGMRSRGMWRPLEEGRHPPHHSSVPHPKPGAVGTLGSPNRGEPRGDRNGHPSPRMGSSGSPRRIGHPVMPMGECPINRNVRHPGGMGCNISNCASNLRGDPRRHPKEILSYRELDEQERFPGLDKDTARTTLHNSSLNLSQHIYSEPSFDHIPSGSGSPNHNGQAPKGKKFSFTFWK